MKNKFKNIVTSASLTEAPFKTAFKATLGVIVAQFLVLIGLIMLFCILMLLK